MEIYNTTWWGNAIDTAITAGTEPDFFGSQMKMLTSQQPELVVNGDFATDSDWAKGNATIADGKATITVVGGAFSYISQGKSFTLGRSYKITAQVQGLSGSNGKQVKFIDNGNNTGGLNISNGTITLDESLQTIEIIWTANANSVAILVTRSTNIGDYSFTIDNVSIKLARAEEVEAVKCLADWIHTTALQDLNN